MSYLTVKNLSITFGDRKILDDVTCALVEGKIHTVIGPNGAGKSSLIKSLTRLIKPESGIIYLDGKLLTSLRSKDLAKIIGTVAQNNQAPSDLTVRELVSHGRFPHRKMFKAPANHDQKIVDQAIEKMNLTQLADRNVNKLSGGERQRAWIGLALAQEPELLILDEPTTYLDIYHQYEILELVRELNKEKDLTVLMVLHDLNHASLYSDYILAIDDHQLIAFGKPAEIFTSEFIHEVFHVDCDCIPSANGSPYMMIKGIDKGDE